MPHRTKAVRPGAVERYLGQIRAWMENPRNARRLRAQVGRWNQLNSCLETLDQTDRAIVAYALHETESDPESGEHYLALYGLLQAMVLQQDAVCHLDEALGGPGTAAACDRALQEIRSIRNWSVGHPTKVDRRDVMSHHQIARPKLGRGFELVSAFDDGRRQFTFVSVADLLRRQRLSVARLLRQMLKRAENGGVKREVTLKTKHELVRSRSQRPAKKAAKQAPEKPAPVVAMPERGNVGDRRRGEVLLPDHLERRRSKKAVAPVRHRAPLRPRRTAQQGAAAAAALNVRHRSRSPHKSVDRHRETTAPTARQRQGSEQFIRRAGVQGRRRQNKRVPPLAA